MSKPLSRREAIRIAGVPFVALLLGAAPLAGCASPGATDAAGGGGAPFTPEESAPETEEPREPLGTENLAEGTETYRGFVLDDVLHDDELGDIHFNLHVPDGYDGTRRVALFVTLPGYQGLYFQGVGANLYTEEFGFVAQGYDPSMIVAAPQLSDWGETSARQTVALTEYLCGVYAVDAARVYLEGYSGGGETLSLVMGMRPELFRRALFCSSRWDGDLAVLAAARVPVCLVVGESDEYYGSGPAREAAEELREIYRADGLAEDDVARLVTLDVKDASYFADAGVTNQHGGGAALFARDGAIMGWLFAE